MNEMLFVQQMLLMGFCLQLIHACLFWIQNLFYMHNKTQFVKLTRFWARGGRLAPF